MATKRENEFQPLSASDVRSAINNGGAQTLPDGNVIRNAQPAAGGSPMKAPTLPDGNAVKNGYTAVTPVTGMDQPTASSAWHNVSMSGKPATNYQQLLAAQPGAYQSPYGTQMQQTLNNLLGQKPFKYDVNTDALYQQIKDNYIKQGRQAMMNTQGQSAALTGGYGNSYGVLAGQQAYQESLGNLADRIPELYQLAANRYDQAEAGQRNNLAALQGMDESAYQRYQYDTQQYETKLQDAYAKYKASQRSGRGNTITYDKFKEYVTDALNWADSTGGDVSEFINQAVTLGTIPQNVGQSVLSAAQTYVDAQNRQSTLAQIEQYRPQTKD